jgi:hypothetical protein
LPLSAALGEGAWLALHRDHELLDRRILDPRCCGKDFDVEIDAATRLEMLVVGGERANIEFKRELPGRDPSGVMKTVAAFANGAGGLCYSASRTMAGQLASARHARSHRVTA